jgi:methylthioribose-1-phosphate isomerase
MTEIQMFKTIEWKNDKVIMIDQTALPEKEVYLTYEDYRDVAEAIKRLIIRGAPAIGVAAAMGIALGSLKISEIKRAEFKRQFDEICECIGSARPTAVNLRWAVERMRKVYDENEPLSIGEIKALLKKEALTIYEEDIEINKALGKHGAKLVPVKAVVLTHCNAGALATAGYGTALGVVRAAVEAGKKVEVYADETRPFLQGARLTAWELMKDNIPVTLITDSMAGYFLKSGKIDLVVVGADRIAANGDTANKIGTYSVAVLAKENGVPFYVAAPTSTIDLRCPSGEKIPIEFRDGEEVIKIGGQYIAPRKVRSAYPAFDVTPAKYITGIITEAGVAKPPFEDSLKKMVEKAAQSKG